MSVNRTQDANEYPREVLDRIRVRICHVFGEGIKRVTDAGLPDKLERGAPHPPQNVDVVRVRLHT